MSISLSYFNNRFKNSMLIIFSTEYLWYMLYQTNLIRTFSRLPYENAIALFNLGVGISLVVGGLITLRLQSQKVIPLWIVIGSIFPLLVHRFKMFENLSLIALGVTWGIGIPSFLSLLQKKIKSEDFARTCSIFMSITFIFVVVVQVLIRNFSTDQQIVLTCLLRFSGILGMIQIKQSAKKRLNEKIKDFSFINPRSFVLYLLCMIAFSFTNALNGYYVVLNLRNMSEIQDISMLANLIQYVGIILSSIVSGFIANKMGRKPVIMFSLVVLGIHWSLGGMGINKILWLAISASSGIAFGIVNTLFVMVIWGELSDHRTSGLYYGLGNSPLFLMMGLMPLLHFFSDVPAYLLALINCIIVFLSIIPLYFAKETMIKTFKISIDQQQVESKLKEIIHSNFFKKLLKKLQKNKDT